MTHKGFTLIENLVSMMLLVLALTSGMTFFYNADQIVTLVVRKKNITEIISARMEEMKQQGYATIVPGTTEENIQVAGLDAQMVVTVMEIDDPVGGGSDYKEVDVAVSWREARENTPRQMAVKTYMAP